MASSKEALREDYMKLGALAETLSLLGGKQHYLIFYLIGKKLFAKCFLSCFWLSL